MGAPSSAAQPSGSAPYRHGQAAKTAVLLVNLGTPDAPTTASVRRYLAEFLSDPRVVEIPPLVWKIILHGVILRIRPAKSAAKYASVWMPEGSPLMVWTAKQAHLMQQAFKALAPDVVVAYAMRYGQPSIASTLDSLRAQGVDRILILPMYPQYSAATTGSVNDEVARWLLKQRWQPSVRMMAHYHDHPAYIDALAQRVRTHWAEHGRSDSLVLSFHGMPARTLQLGDPYHCQCLKTARLLRETLGLTEQQVRATFQSRFGKAKWLEPYTEPTLVAMAQAGVQRVTVMCPGFVADCLETLEEIDMEAREAFLSAGGQAFHYIPALNDSEPWIAAMVTVAQAHLGGWLEPLPSPHELQAQCQRARQAGAQA
jgi:protoporphyrin/coproporphyrin ferrochelatase